MDYEVEPSRASIDVGPPDGPHHTIPRAFTINIPAQGELPYDVTIKTQYDHDEHRHVIVHVAFDRPDNGHRIRTNHITKYGLYDIIETVLQDAVIGPDGWEVIVQRHDDEHPQEVVDALVYLLSHAVGSQKPTATVATARGLAPGSGPKRVSAARRLGHIPEAHHGKAG